MIEVEGLCKRYGSVEILRGINLTVNAGEVHAIMGPNGSGKSTLAGVLAGRDAYEVTEGEVLFEGKNLLDAKDPDGFQYVRAFIASGALPDGGFRLTSPRVPISTLFRPVDSPQASGESG